MQTGANSTVSKKPISLAFINPFNLFDASSGAVQSLRTMLEQLSQYGFQCHALTGCCFEGETPASLVDLMAARGLVANGQIQSYGIPVWRGNLKGVSYNAIQLPTLRRDQMPALEELIFRDTVRIWLQENKPDIVLTFGGYLLDIEIQRCAKAMGAKVVFYLANSHYHRQETFSLVDLVITNSAASARHYKSTLNLDCHDVGIFVDSASVVAQQRNQHYVTFINPLPEKGVTLFLKLVEKAMHELPEMDFLVVESRGRLSLAIEQLNLSPALLQRITLLPLQENMALVYARTRILLMPSFWLESAGRILIEANANGIPVLASDRGGIPETLGMPERLLPIPEQAKLNHWMIPSAEEVEPWWQQLSKLWRDPAYYHEWSQNSILVSKKQTLHTKTANLAAVLRTLN